MEPGNRLDRLTAGEWAQILSRYHEPNHAFNVFELAITAGAFIALWIVMWVALSFGYRIATAGFLVRLLARSSATAWRTIGLVA
jgi:hypothetical protein